MNQHDAYKATEVIDRCASLSFALADAMLAARDALNAKENEEVAQLRADKARIDWMDATDLHRVVEAIDIQSGKLRASIDTAMKAK